MVKDATFSDGYEQPVRLNAETDEDLQVLSALVQDAVFPIREMSWQAGKRRFALLLNRFRWEDRDKAENQGRRFERVQSVLLIDGVLKVSSSGIDRTDKETILSLLAIAFTPMGEGAGRIELTLAGDGAIALEVECLDVSLRDVTRPYVAPSRGAPDHGLEDG